MSLYFLSARFFVWCEVRMIYFWSFCEARNSCICYSFFVPFRLFMNRNSNFSFLSTATTHWWDNIYIFYFILGLMLYKNYYLITHVWREPFIKFYSSWLNKMLLIFFSTTSFIFLSKARALDSIQIPLNNRNWNYFYFIIY